MVKGGTNFEKLVVKGSRRENAPEVHLRVAILLSHLK